MSFNLRSLIGIHIRSKGNVIARICSVRDLISHEYRIRENGGDKHWVGDEEIMSLIGIKPKTKGKYKSRIGKKIIKVVSIRTERKGVRFKLHHEQYGLDGAWLTWHDLKRSEVVLSDRRTVVGGIQFDRSPLMEQIERIQEEEKEMLAQ